MKNVCLVLQTAPVPSKVRSTEAGVHNPSLEGECDILEDNLVEIVGNVESVELCETLCSENSDCNVYTYLGEENHFR